MDFAIQVPARELRQNGDLEPFGLVVTEWWWWYGATPGGLRPRVGATAGGRSRGLPTLLLPGPPVRVLEPEVADELAMALKPAAGDPSRTAALPKNPQITLLHRLQK